MIRNCLLWAIFFELCCAVYYDSGQWNTRPNLKMGNHHFSLKYVDLIFKGESASRLFYANKKMIGVFTL